MTKAKPCRAVLLPIREQVVCPFSTPCAGVDLPSPSTVYVDFYIVVNAVDAHEVPEKLRKRIVIESFKIMGDRFVVVDWTAFSFPHYLLRDGCSIDSQADSRML